MFGKNSKMGKASKKGKNAKASSVEASTEAKGIKACASGKSSAKNCSK